MIYYCFRSGTIMRNKMVQPIAVRAFHQSTMISEAQTSSCIPNIHSPLLSYQKHTNFVRGNKGLSYISQTLGNGFNRFQENKIQVV